MKSPIINEKLEVFMHFNYYNQMILNLTQSNSNTSTNTLR